MAYNQNILPFCYVDIVAPTPKQTEMTFVITSKLFVTWSVENFRHSAYIIRTARIVAALEEVDIMFAAVIIVTG